MDNSTLGDQQDANREQMHEERGGIWRAAPSTPYFVEGPFQYDQSLMQQIYSLQYKPSNKSTSIVINKSYISALDGTSLWVSWIFPLSEKIKVMCLLCLGYWESI